MNRFKDLHITEIEDLWEIYVNSVRYSKTEPNG